MKVRLLHLIYLNLKFADSLLEFCILRIAFSIQLQLEDIENLFSTFKGKHREDESSDAELALRLYKGELDVNASIISDRQTHSLSHATTLSFSDRNLVMFSPEGIGRKLQSLERWIRASSSVSKEAVHNLP
jgi:hypothetical protein